MHRVSIPREVVEEAPRCRGPVRSGKYEQPATAKAIRMTLARTITVSFRQAMSRRTIRPLRALARDHQLVQMERQAARGLRRLAGGRRDLFDEIHLPALFQDLLARERAQARAALEALVFAGKLVVIDGRGARRGPRPGGGYRRRRLRLFQRFRIVADFLPLFPGIA